MADNPRILVNDRFLLHGGTGITVYLQNVLENWPADAETRPVGFCSRLLRGRAATHATAPVRRALPGRLKDLTPRRTAPSLGRSFLHGTLQSAYALAFRAAYRTQNFAAYFEPNYLAVRCGGPTITTMHDLSLVEHPEWHPPARRAACDKHLPASIDVTQRWIAVSSFTRDRMVLTLGIPAARIDVVPLAGRILPGAGETRSSEIRQAMGLPPKYLLHLGDIQPRKNIITLLDAYALLPASLRRENPLVLAGPVGWGDQQFWRSLIEHPIAAEVLTVGYVQKPDIAPLLSGALALLAPSHYEGFGLPLLEAMACGTPVVCSNIAAFQEVAGNAAALIAPDDVECWSQTIKTAVENSKWRAQLQAAGLCRAELFSWQTTARRHAEIFAQALGKQAIDSARSAAA